MAKRVGGARRKTRSIFKKDKKTKGKISLKRYFQEFKDGDKVFLVAEPAVQKGIYFRRFHGKSGNVVGKQGSNYYIQIKDGNKTKKVLTHPIHIKKA